MRTPSIVIGSHGTGATTRIPSRGVLAGATDGAAHVGFGRPDRRDQAPFGTRSERRRGRTGCDRPCGTDEEGAA